MSTSTPLTHSEAVWMLSLPDSELIQWLGQFEKPIQAAILNQLRQTRIPTVETAKEYPEDFRRLLKIEGGHIFDDVLDPWQRKDFEATDGGWRRAAGYEDQTGFSRSYSERPRGHSKTTDQAVAASWALYGAQNMIKGVAGACDKDQAKMLRDAIQRLCMENDWLNAVLDVQAYRVVNKRTGSYLQMLAADEHSNYGETPDFTIIDELTHWRNQGLWNALFSAAPKRPNSMLAVISNAGTGQGLSWQWKIREKCRKSNRWYFSRLEGPQASWQKPEDLKEQQDLLPPKAFNRLWKNLWTVDGGDAIDTADVEACCVLPGPLRERFDPWGPFIGGLDLGIKRDHSAFVILGMDAKAGRFKLVHCESWQPSDFAEGRVQFSAIRKAIQRANERFGLEAIYFDPNQALNLQEDMANLGVNMVELPFTSANCNLMATRLTRTLRGRFIDMFPDEALKLDLSQLSIVQTKLGGFRLDGISNDDGHQDRGIALGISLGVAWDVMREEREAMNLEPLSHLVAA